MHWCALLTTLGADPTAQTARTPQERLRILEPMPPRTHRVVDIAAQAGLSRATVDRVLHRRPGVRAATVAGERYGKYRRIRLTSVMTSAPLNADSNPCSAAGA